MTNPIERDVMGYWEVFGPRLQAEVQRRIILEVDQAVLFSVAFYSCVMETFTARATKNQPLLDKIGAAIVHVQDALRGVLAGYRDQSPVTLAAAHRIALEQRCNMRFVFQSGDPAKYADRWWRFLEVERFLWESKRIDPAQPVVPPAELARIQGMCPEWIQNGKVVRKHWTAEPSINSFRDVAERVGMLNDYLSMYSSTSKFVHGSPLLKNIYRGVCLGAPAENGTQAMLGSTHSIYMLTEMAEAFGVAYRKDDYIQWAARIVAAEKRVGGGT
jgi:hypothetical protein